MKKSNFALRLQPSLMEEARKVAKAEGVAVNQLINVAIAEKLAQLRTAKWFADRIAAGDPAAGAKLLQDLRRGGNVRPRKGDEVAGERKRSGRSRLRHGQGGTL